MARLAGSGETVMDMAHEVDRYFAHIASGTYADVDDLQLNLLGRTEAELFSEDFEFHPVVMVLDALVLDDPGTSNHHVLLGRSPLEGQVLYLMHDGESRVVFASLEEFLAAADRALAENLVLPEIHPVISPRPADQECLRELVDTLLAGDEIEVVLALIPSLELDDATQLRQLVAHEDFLLGEMVALEIIKRPDALLQELAGLCAAHPHPQVARAGERALRAIRTLQEKHARV